MWPDRSREVGSGTVLAATIVLFAGLLVFLTVAVLVGVLSWHRARAAADLAALAGAAEIASGGSPCLRAQETALRNGAVLMDCQPDGEPSAWAVTVVVRVANPVRWSVLPAGFDARARAGRADAT